MSVYVLGDEETVLGFQLAGIRGEVPEDEEKARELINDRLKAEGLEILVVTEELARKLGSKVEGLDRSKLKPLVVEIPSGERPGPAETLRRRVQRHVGIQLGKPERRSDES